MEVAGPLGTPLGLAQRKRASPRGEAGTSGFLCVSDSDRRVPAELGQESQASSCLRKGTPLASRVAQGVSDPWSSCVWNPRVFTDDARVCSLSIMSLRSIQIVVSVIYSFSLMSRIPWYGRIIVQLFTYCIRTFWLLHITYYK